jgi:nucleotide-binding universal stress UspA family protein
MTEKPEALFRLLLVGADGSEGSRRAVEWAGEMARATGASVCVAHVLTYDHELVHDLTLDTMRTWRKELQLDLETRWVEPLRAGDVDHRCIVVEGGSPAAALVEVAEREGVDLVIVGAKGRGNLAGRVLGGVSYRLAHRARQPVVVVPPDWQPRRA